MSKIELMRDLVCSLFELDRETGDLRSRITGKVYRSRDTAGYIQARVKGRQVQAHRIIFLMVNGWLPVQVDHRDGCRANNRPSNLRAATPQQNAFNQGARSGLKGVTQKKYGYEARIRDGGKQTYLGFFSTAEAAHAAYVAAARRLHGEFARFA